MFISGKHRLFSIIFEKKGSPWKYRPRCTSCSEKWTDLIPEKNVKNRDLGISKISSIDEVDRIYMASPRGLSVGKTQPPDYILMFSSANVPGITYKMKFGDRCPPFLKNIVESSPSRTLNRSLSQEISSTPSHPRDCKHFDILDFGGNIVLEVQSTKLSFKIHY